MLQVTERVRCETLGYEKNGNRARLAIALASRRALLVKAPNHLLPINGNGARRRNGYVYGTRLRLHAVLLRMLLACNMDISLSPFLASYPCSTKSQLMPVPPVDPLCKGL